MTDQPQYPTAELPWPPPARTPKPRKWLRRYLFGGAFAVTLLAGIGMGAGIESGGNGTNPAIVVTSASPIAVPGPTVTVTSVPGITTTSPAVKPKPTPPPKPAKATIPDGYSADITADVPAGKYKARSDSLDCYYEIDKTGTSDIVDNGGFIKGTLTVTLKKGETFSSTACGDWTQQ